MEASLEELRILAVKLARKRLHRQDSDLEQELWIKAWQVQDQPEGYIVRSLKNRIIDYLEGVRLGSVRANHGGRGTKIVHYLLSFDASPVSIQKMPSLALPEFPEDHVLQLDWAIREAATPFETALVRGVAKGLTPTEVARRMGYSRSFAGKTWRSLVPKLKEAYLHANRV